MRREGKEGWNYLGIRSTLEALLRPAQDLKAARLLDLTHLARRSFLIVVVVVHLCARAVDTADRVLRREQGLVVGIVLVKTRSHAARLVEESRVIHRLIGGRRLGQTQRHFLRDIPVLLARHHLHASLRAHTGLSELPFGVLTAFATETFPIASRFFPVAGAGRSGRRWGWAAATMDGPSPGFVPARRSCRSFLASFLCQRPEVFLFLGLLLLGQLLLHLRSLLHFLSGMSIGSEQRFGELRKFVVDRNIL
jgi:hypothetical protein